MAPLRHASDLEGTKVLIDVSDTRRKRGKFSIEASTEA
jgi:hypothetical protein